MARGKQNQAQGVCALTKRTGPFVASHIIPQALTRPSARGAPLIQYGGGPPTRHWSSWYDTELVTADGERYLSDLDNWAITELRRHKLVWSGWHGGTSLGKEHTPFYSSLGIRAVSGLNTGKLRLFFHSLLWRSAASMRPEFRDITVSPEDLELLRLAILGETDPPINFYPIQLTQLSTKGLVHNQTPIPDVKYFPHPLVPGGQPIPLPTFRFYFDGLIAHVHRATPRGYDVESLGNLVLGAKASIVLSTVTFEDSVQSLDIAKMLRDAEN